MSSAIGKLMLDTLMESAHHLDVSGVFKYLKAVLVLICLLYDFQDIMSFFSIFVKLKDSVTSKAFKVKWFHLYEV